MVRNVLMSWLTQAVTIAAGFVMPRLIDRNLGQELLGVWDFSWSIVGYFALAQVGITGSINRYVARYRTEGDNTAINRAISSVFCVLLAMAFAILFIATLIGLWALPHFGAGKLGLHLADAQWVIIILGLEIALETLFSSFGGVLTGCHSWKRYYGIQTVTNIFTVVGMAGVILFGGSLRAVALVHLLGVVGCWSAITLSAYRVLPGLRVRFTLATRAMAGEMFSFGAKSFLPQIGELLLNQTVNVLVLVHLGPAALALYSRPRSLVQQTRTLVARMSGILIPSVSSIHASGDLAQIREVIVKGTRYGAFLTLPVALVVAAMGGPILYLWMGPSYQSDIIPIALTAGTTAMIILTPALCALVGMNLHGPPGRIHFITCAITAASVWIALGWFKVGVTGAAVCAGLPLALVYSFYMPVYIARHLKISVLSFLKQGVGGPVLVCLPLLLCLLLSRWLFFDRPVLALVVGCLSGGTTLLPLYWRYAMPGSLKERVRHLCCFGSRLKGASA
jgi:O-antigen/teichoic acid export membrane protein